MHTIKTEEGKNREIGNHSLKLMNDGFKTKLHQNNRKMKEKAIPVKQKATDTPTVLALNRHQFSQLLAINANEDDDHMAKNVLFVLLCPPTVHSLLKLMDHQVYRVAASYECQ